MLNFDTDNSAAGFRLKYLQVYNWGLYNKEIFSINPDSNSSLLIGANASGKSTLVDALLSIFLSDPKYNLAADSSKKKDRNITSYVLGAYKELTNEKGEIEPQYLRSKNDFSMILATFYNEGLNQSITLAQYFWFDIEEAKKPNRIYIISYSKALDIEKDFELEEVINKNDFVTRLKKIGIVSENDNKVKKKTGIYTDSFTVYSNKFSEIFGLREKDKALHLFNQTVSLKNVGDINAFVKNEMLYGSKPEAFINELKTTFDDVNRIADKIEEAKKKIEALELIEERYLKDDEKSNILSYKTLKEKIAEKQGCLDSLPSFFSEIKLDLLEKEKLAAEGRQKELSIKQERYFADGGILDITKRKNEGLVEDIALTKANLGLSNLQTKKGETEKLLENARSLFSKYQTIVQTLKLKDPTSESDFRKNYVKLQESYNKNKEKATSQKQSEEQIIKDLAPVEIAISEKTGQIERLEKNKTSLIDSKFVIAREEICKFLKIDVTELPFIGELLQVKASEKEWRGSIEKLFKGFGLSLLIEEALYEKAKNFINDYTFNNVQVNFYKIERISEQIGIPKNKNHLFYKLEIKADAPSEIRLWLEEQLIVYNDFICCDKTELKKYKRAITEKGLIKRNNSFHQKDDRKKSNNPSEWILGWDNKAKIKLLKEDLKKLTVQQGILSGQKEEAEKAASGLTEQNRTIEDLLAITSFEEINVPKIEKQLGIIIKSISDLDKDNALKELQVQKDSIDRYLKRLELFQNRLTASLTELKTLLTGDNGLISQIEKSKEISKLTTTEEKEKFYPLLQTYHKEILFYSKEIDGVQNNLNQLLSKELATLNPKRYKSTEFTKLELLGQEISSSMQSFCKDFPLTGKEQDLVGNLSYIKEFLDFLNELRKENLPQYQDDFNEKLREQTDNKLIDFRRHLHKEKDNIKLKIKNLNDSLAERHYEPGKTFIQLVPREVKDEEISKFEEELKDCFYPLGKELTKHERDAENDRVYQNIKQLLGKLEKINSISGEDARWARKVTDVRNWFAFSASEKDIFNPEREIKAHSGTAGQSGGETGKITYTILATSIAFQFGLDGKNVKTNSLRFVAIDEIFNNLGLKYCHYVLKMFSDMNLQLLIVSPDSLEKVHIAEQYVKNVHWTYKKTEALNNREEDYSYVFDIPRNELMEKIK